MSGLILLLLTSACSRMEIGKEFIATLESIAGPSDRYFTYQWNLLNTGQMGGVPGEDVNVMGAWEEGNFGDGVLIAVVDDGAEITHPDLVDNVAAGASYNYNDGSDDPVSRASTCEDSACHGTAVASIILGVRNNGIGISGVAPKAKLSAFNYILSNQSSATEQDAMTRNAANVAASNNSWGPRSFGEGHFRPSSAPWRAAIETGLSTGRGGKGIVYSFAAGNGAQSILDPTEIGDTSNLNGYANFYGVMAVCAVNHKGVVSDYSEPGANLWVCAPSSKDAEETSDVLGADLAGSRYGYNVSSSRRELTDRSYTQRFGGTSAAAPIVTGVVALILKERPDLSWRDVRQIIARSARKNHPTSSGWEKNGAIPPLNIHYDYGFGVADATAAVRLARAWTPISGPLKTFSQSTAVNIAIDDMGTVATAPITVTGSDIGKIEYIEITTNITHPDWGNLTIDLKRSGVDPITTASRLTLNHRCSTDPFLAMNVTEANCAVPGNVFRFGSARHLGEPADGVWTLEVRDGDTLEGKADGLAGTLAGWTIKFYGE